MQLDILIGCDWLDGFGSARAARCSSLVFGWLGEYLSLVEQVQDSLRSQAWRALLRITSVTRIHLVTEALTVRSS
jgi:hypothetical protein